MGKKVREYFKNRVYEYHLFRILGFSLKDYTTFKIASAAKQKNAGVWFFNNLWFPILVIVSPITLTFVHKFWNTVSYSKSLLEILIGGSLTLLGINVLRTSSTAISEKLDKTKVPSQFSEQVDYLIDEIEMIRSKLERKVWIATFLGWGLYLLQMGQLINVNSSMIYIVFVCVVLLTFTSILYGRFIFLMKTNLFDKEEAIRLLFSKLINQKDEFNRLEDLLKSQGL
ncbi:MAG: hypothetical protein EOO43_22675 [Flavobacterium sp.]|nr:MAG: hypothetical protein EOO43_22675 [Flavobacterium sp.]